MANIPLTILACISSWNCKAGYKIANPPYDRSHREDFLSDLFGKLDFAALKNGKFSLI
jgi:hypothetical protein